MLLQKNDIRIEPNWKYMYGARHGTMALTIDDLADCNGSGNTREH